LLARLRVDKAVDLSRLSMRLAVQVTGRVVGLTNSSVRGMSGRLGFFQGDPLARDRALLLRALRGSGAPGLLPPRREASVRRAAAALSRRDQPAVATDFSDLEILTEALTYAAAGMATTRGSSPPAASADGEPRASYWPAEGRTRSHPA
jgi:hypothetical protein